MTVIRFVLPVLTFLGVFFFPWTMTVVLMSLSGLIFPPVAIATGILADVMYYPGVGLPLASITGVVIALMCTGVRYVAKERILRA